MSTKLLALGIAVAILFLATDKVLARRVNHQITSASIDRLPFKLSVKVKDVEKLKEFEITISGLVGNLTRQPGAPGGWLTIIGNNKPIAVKPSTVDRTATFTFQIKPEQLDKARFEFVEDAADWNGPFPTHGDLYQFKLKEFLNRGPLAPPEDESAHRGDARN